MKRLNGMFVFLILMLGIMSIAYIWKAEENRKSLEKQVDVKEQQISSLKDEIIDLESNQGSVMGDTKTAIGTVVGLIEINNEDDLATTIVCAEDNFTDNEFCTDEFIKTNDLNIYQYLLEIPKGKYLIYMLPNPEQEKKYYSKIQRCADEGCENNRKIILEISEEETQQDINIF